MTLDNEMLNIACKWMPKLKEFAREDVKLTVKVDCEMYGLIQSAKLWYNEPIRCL